MPDNVAITAGTGTSIASDDIGGVQYQRVKNVWGADGVANDVSATNPMPVVETRTVLGSLAAYFQVAGGTGAANLGAISNPAASGRVVRIRRVLLTITAIAATTAVANLLMTRSTAVHAGGTGVTVAEKRSADSGNVATVASGAVTGVTGTTNLGGVIMPFGAAVGYNNTTLLLDAKTPEDEIILLAGEALYFRTDAANDADFRFGFQIEWFEV